LAESPLGWGPFTAWKKSEAAISCKPPLQWLPTALLSDLQRTGPCHLPVILMAMSNLPVQACDADDE
jgi:hypothetical protein